MKKRQPSVNGRSFRKLRETFLGGVRVAPNPRRSKLMSVEPLESRLLLTSTWGVDLDLPADAYTLERSTSSPSPLRTSSLYESLAEGEDIPANDSVIDLLAASDSGAHDDDNTTNLTNLSFEVTGVIDGGAGSIALWRRRAGRRRRQRIDDYHHDIDAGRPRRRKLRRLYDTDCRGCGKPRFAAISGHVLTQRPRLHSRPRPPLRHSQESC